MRSTTETSIRHRQHLLDDPDRRLGASYVDHWPTNPYLGVPMQDNTATGNYTYTQTNGGSGFMLVGHMNSNGFTVP